MAEQTLKAYLDSLTEDTAPDAAADFVITKDTSASLLKQVKLNKIGGSAFGTVAVSGQSDVVADQINDTLTLVAGSNVTITTDATGDSVTIAASGGGGGSALIYSANVDQTGIGNPVGTVFENTLGGTVSWIRSTVGIYRGQLSGAFTFGQTHALANISNVGSGVFRATIEPDGGGDYFWLKTYDSSGSAIELDGGTISVYIRVYP